MSSLRTKNKEMKVPAEIEFKMNLGDTISKLQRLGEAAHKAVDAVDDFNKALENCKRMDLEISINYTSKTKKENWLKRWWKKYI